MSRTHSRFAGVLAVAALILVRAAGGQDSRVESAPSSRPIDPSARWIWAEGALATDAYRIFRKSFDLAGAWVPVSMRISADREYRLYVNDAYVGRGPAPSPPGRASVDEINLGPYVRSGRNSVAVLVHGLGLPSFQRPLASPGLIAEIWGMTFVTQRIVTDASWLTHDAWWVPTGERFSPFREFTEHLDARREPSGWKGVDCDDSGWKPAALTGDEGRTLEARDLPMPDWKPVLPLGLVFTAGCAGAAPPKAEAAKELATLPTRLAPAGAVSGDLGLRTKKGDGLAVTAREDGVAIALDFGREVSGFPTVEAEAEADGVVLDLGYGEGRQGAGSVTVFHQNYPACDRMTLRKGTQTLQIFHHRAFRYLVVAVRTGVVRIKSVSVAESGYPAADRGAFTCSDPDLVRIWEAGRLTTRLCMDQGFMDCPWRERGQYIGDAIVEAPVALYAFGDTKLARRFLRQAQFCQPADGLLEPAYPCDWTSWHGARGPNRIPGYGALWVVLLEDWLRASGDEDLARQLLLVMDRQLAWFAPFRGPDGLLASAPEWNFIDWAHLDERTALACLNLQYLMALRAAARIEATLGQRTGLSWTAHKVASAFRTAHWDEEKGLFRDAEGIYSAHTNALALLTLVDDEATASRVLAGVPASTRPGSPYFDGFVLQALARHGRHREALALIRERWLPMLASGSATLWEMYSPAASLCHGWSSAPTSFLQREILGLSWDATNRTVRFAPRLGDLTRVEGLVPFPCGDVSARIVFEGEKRSASISTPRDVTILVDLPPVGQWSMIDGADTPKGHDMRLPGGSYRFVTGP